MPRLVRRLLQRAVHTSTLPHAVARALPRSRYDSQYNHALSKSLLRLRLAGFAHAVPSIGQTSNGAYQVAVAPFVRRLRRCPVLLPSVGCGRLLQPLGHERRPVRPIHAVPRIVWHLQ